MATIIPKTMSDLSKLEPLDSINYQRWSQKILIFFKQLGVNYMLSKDMSIEQFDIAVISTTPITTPPSEKN